MLLTIICPWQALFLDSINLGFLNIPDHIVPIISAFDCERLTKMIEAVRQNMNEHSFGNNEEIFKLLGILFLLIKKIILNYMILCL